MLKFQEREVAGREEDIAIARVEQVRELKLRVIYEISLCCRVFKGLNGVAMWGKNDQFFRSLVSAE